MRIVITGSPGTGKSTISRLLSARLGIPIIDLKLVARQKNLVGKNREVDIGKLAKALRPLFRQKDYIAEGHLACEFRIPTDFIFVLRASPATLRKRLGKRRYGAKKLAENVMSEMLDYCAIRSRSEYAKPPLELDTSSRSEAGCVREMVNAIKRKKKKLDSVDYSGELKEQLKLR